MLIDPIKMRSARDRRALTQENLAHQARVNVRTIQRAECGMPIRAETVQEIAAVLGVPVAGLRRPDPKVEPEVAVAGEIGWGANSHVLKRVDGAEQVVSALERAVMSHLACSVDPSEETMPALRSLIKCVEGLQRDPWCFEESSPLSFTSLLDRLDALAALNAALSEVERCGLALYMGTEPKCVKRPYGIEEGHMVTKVTQRTEFCTAVRFLIAHYTAERIKVPDDVRWPLPEEEEPPF